MALPVNNKNVRNLILKTTIKNMMMANAKLNHAALVYEKIKAITKIDSTEKAIIL